MRLPFDEVSLIRTVHSERHRAGMDARGRRETVAEAFSVRYPRLIEDESVFLSMMSSPREQLCRHVQRL